MRPLQMLAIATLPAACGSQPLPPDVGGKPLWVPLDGASSTDRGEPTGPIPPEEQRAAGPIRLVDVSDAVGLAGIEAGATPTA